MEQLQHEVHVLMWANLVVAGVFGFLVFCWLCEFLNKWMGTSNTNRRSRRKQQESEKQLATQQAFQEAVAAEVAKLTGERAT